jgi:hypothetical protein
MKDSTVLCMARALRPGRRVLTCCPKQIFRYGIASKEKNSCREIYTGQSPGSLGGPRMKAVVVNQMIGMQ